MTARKACFALIASLLLSGGAKAACPAGSKIAEWVPAGNLCLAAHTRGVERPTALVVLLHGDAFSGGRADYLNEVADQLAGSGVTAVALIRPGYSDGEKRTSGGTHHGRSDNYTPTNIAAIEAAIRSLSKHYQPRRIVVMGHSGGAAIAGVLIGKAPGPIHGAALVSCPCDITALEKRSRAKAMGA